MRKQSPPKSSPEPRATAGDYLTSRDAADHLGLTPKALLRSTAPRYKLGHSTVRFLRHELDAWMASHRIGERVTPEPPKPREARLPEPDLEFASALARWK